MSVTQSYDSFNANAGAPPPPNAEFDANAQLDEASASGEGNAFGQGILGGQLGNITQQATQVAKQGADAVVNAGKGIIEMGGSVISGLKRGFSKTSETGGE